MLSIDVDAAEARLQREPRHEETAEREFERLWAVTLLESVLAKLRQQYVEREKGRLFESLQGCLIAGEALDYEALAPGLETTPGALKVAAHRLRQRYRELLREEIAHTVDDEGEVTDELQHLLQALRRG